MIRKTPVAVRFLKRLAEINDQICFSALRQWEFDKNIRAIAEPRAQEFTSAVFTGNPFSMRIYRRIGDLPRFSSDAEQIALRMGVIASVEHVLVCLGEMQKFRASVAAADADTIEDKAEEEQLRLKIEALSGRKPTAEYFRTIGLLRMLRNHYAHLNDKPHPALKSYVAAHAKALNRFWAGGVTQLQGLDFRTISSSPLTFDLTVVIVNLLRISVLHIDQMLAATLDFDDVASWVLSEMLNYPRNRQLGAERLTAKVKLRLEMEFGHSCDLDGLVPLVERLYHSRRTEK